MGQECSRPYGGLLQSEVSQNLNSGGDESGVKQISPLSPAFVAYKPSKGVGRGANIDHWFVQDITGRIHSDDIFDYLVGRSVFIVLLYCYHTTDSFHVSPLYRTYLTTLYYTECISLLVWY